MLHQSEQPYDTIIVGAGVNGLGYASTLQKLSPNSSYIIFDSNLSLGGNWCKEALYKGLRTNNIAKTVYFPEFPLSETDIFKKDGLSLDEHLSGNTVNAYLQEFAKHEGILSKIRCGTDVTSAKEIGLEDGTKGWRVTTVHKKSMEAPREYVCRRLVVATGSCSVPGRLSFPGIEGFGKPCVNFAQYRKDDESYLNNDKIKHVTVSGESKSAMDVVYSLATAGKQVTWILRKSSNGPRYIAARPYANIGPFRKWLEGLVLTRAVTWFSASFVANADGFGPVRRFLHETSFGRTIASAFWSKLTYETNLQSGLLDSEGKMKPLIPRDSLMWHGAQSSILNYPTEFVELLRSGQVQIRENDIVMLSDGGQVHLDDNQTFTTDSLVAITGWQHTPTLKFADGSKHADYGISSRSYSKSQKESWNIIEERAQADLLERLPSLASSPYFCKPTVIRNVDAERAAYEPWRLYHSIVPPSQAASGSRNLAFLGHLQTFHTFLDAQVMSLWTYAYFNDKLARDPAKESSDLILRGDGINDVEERLKYQTAVMARWALLRHPFGCAKDGMLDAMMDGLPYIDLLLSDLGLNTWRKGGWLQEILGGPCVWEDYRGIVEEWKQSNYKLQEKKL